MSQSELSSVGSDSAGNSGNDERGDNDDDDDVDDDNDERGSLIGDRGRTLQRQRTLGRTSSSGNGSRLGGVKRGDDAAGDYPTVKMPLLNNLNL